jgi:hypothetical protein
MSEVKKFGPYKGSEQNGGRPIYVYKKKVGNKWVTTSKNKARADYEDKTGKKLSKNTDVDHKDNNHNNDSKKNLRPLAHGKNTAKENKRRAGKKENEK